MEFREVLEGALVLGPMTKGSNLPYRRLCAGFGAPVTMGEMALARKLRRRSPSELALLRRAPDETCFGVQLASNDPEELEWAAALAEERGADFVDLNLGCPIHDMTRRGIGAALLRKPGRVGRLVEGMKKGARRVPVTVKIRLGWSEEKKNHVEVARAAQEAGAAAVAVHGRTRLQRYKKSADWDAIGEVVAALSIPVIGNGDLLFPHEIEEARRRSGCTALMTARGALIKPWIFQEAREGYADPGDEERLACYRRYVGLCREHWGEDDHARRRIREFLLWHLDFWHRYRPRLPDGTWPRMQERSAGFVPRSPLEALLCRPDAEAHAWLADALLDDRPVDPSEAPPPPEHEPQEGRGGERSWEA